MIRLAQRQFTEADQNLFAAISGDRNPMHVDALQARRTQAGAPVVHGIHLLLWALDSLAAQQPDIPPLRTLRAQFKKFVYVDERVETVLTQQRESGARLSVIAGGAPRSRVSIEFGEPVESCPEWPAFVSDLTAFSPIPLDPAFEQFPGLAGRLLFHMTPQDAAALFPAATKWLGARRIAALAASTYLVGMVCPGRYSLYSELSIGTCAETVVHGARRETLAFRVNEADSRFRSVDLEIAGDGMTGMVKSFARHPPVAQATMESLAGLVAPAEFAGSHVLIVGGSRGLGELTAKLIATGGGRVAITWQTGKEDAERVAREIRTAGGACETIAYDARRPAAEQLAALAEPPTHAYYFATPSIFRPQAEMFVQERLAEFLAVYVDGFWDLSHALRMRRPETSLFYPSSIAVTERPRGMTEYAMAKASGEVLCADMKASLGPLHVTVSRLPRLPTDQTATFADAETASPVEIMLPIIREVQSWPRPRRGSAG